MIILVKEAKEKIGSDYYFPELGRMEKVLNNISNDNCKIDKLYKQNKKNKRQIAFTFYKIINLMKGSKEHDCSIISEDLKLVDLAYEGIQSEDDSFKAAIYLRPDNSYILKIELKRKNSGIFSSDKKDFEFDVEVDYDGDEGDYKNFCLNFIRRDSHKSIVPSKLREALVKVASEIFPWEDYTKIHYSDKWFYKQNSAEVMKTFSNAIDTSSLSSKYDSLRELLP